jgi:hypothetical protein
VSVVAVLLPVAHAQSPVAGASRRSTLSAPASHPGEPHGDEPPPLELVVREMSAHRRHKHLIRHNITTFAQLTAVELRGLEPLTL